MLKVDGEILADMKIPQKSFSFFFRPLSYSDRLPGYHLSYVFLCSVFYVIFLLHDTHRSFEL